METNTRERLVLTLSDEERRALELLAKQDLRGVRDQVRVLVRAEAQRRGLWPVPSSPKSAASEAVRP